MAGEKILIVEDNRMNMDLAVDLLELAGFDVVQAELPKAGAVIAISHHEKWDGSGYPKGLAGEEIPLWGRISAVADVFDALTSKRPYKEAFSNEKAYAILKEGRGKHFDPRVLDVFFKQLEEILVIQDKYRAGQAK